MDICCNVPIYAYIDTNLVVSIAEVTPAVYCGTKFLQILRPVRENIIVNMLFSYISTMITYLVCKKLNAKILF